MLISFLLLTKPEPHGSSRIPIGFRANLRKDGDQEGETHLLLVPKALVPEPPPKILVFVVFDVPKAGLGAPPLNTPPVLFGWLVLFMRLELAKAYVSQH